MSKEQTIQYINNELKNIVGQEIPTNSYTLIKLIIESDTKLEPMTSGYSFYGGHTYLLMIESQKYYINVKTGRTENIKYIKSAEYKELKAKS